MISYAQNQEDVLLNRVFPARVPGFYVDVGASHPVVGSVTKHFYDAGWQGVNVEPALAFFDALRADRDRDVNLNIGLSDEPGTLAFCEAPGTLAGGSTFAAQEAARLRAGVPCTDRTVEVRTLAQVCDVHVGDRVIDFMSIDTEGFEARVIAGGDWNRWRPRVVVVEATRPRTSIPTHDAWEPLLLGARYRFAFFDGLNRFYVREEDAALAEALAVPANVLDDYVLHAASEAAAQLGAARAVNEALLAEQDELGRGLALLRDRCEELLRQLDYTRAEHEVTRDMVVATYARHLEQTAASEIGPVGLALARRLRSLSMRFPRCGSATKRALRTARRLASATSR